MARAVGTADINGLDETLAAFSLLTGKPARRVLRKAINAGANQVVRRAKALVPVESGTLKRSIGKKVGTSRDKSHVYAVIGPREDQKYVTFIDGKKRDPANYVHLVELGTEHSAAKPFLRPAIESTRGEVVSAMSKKAGPAIDIEVKKLGRGLSLSIRDVAAGLL